MLQGFTWCAVYDRLMQPLQLSTGVCHYGCTDRECPRPYILAEMAERVVWDCFAFLNEAKAQGVAPHSRRTALREVLSRVWVGKEVYDLYYDWRD
jgi:hypothetical protein